MSENRRQIAATMFRPVPGGFIYRAPNPWVFGRGNHYIVNEQQRAELLAILVSPPPLLRLAVVVVGVLLWGLAMGTIGSAFSGHEGPTVGDAVIMIVMTFAVLFLALHLAIRSKLRRVQPILAAATLTTTAITLAEIRVAMNQTTSVKTALAVAAMFIFGCAAQIAGLVIRNPQHPLFSDVQSDLSVFLLLLCTAMAARSLALAFAKIRHSQAAA
jgi:hypothetical protein